MAREASDTDRVAAAVLAAGAAPARALLAHLPGAAAFVVDRELRYVLAEGEGLAAAGLAPADLVGRTVAEAFRPGPGAPYAANYRRALAGEAFDLEHAEGGRDFITRGVPLRDPDGCVIGVLAVSTDLTARRRADAALHESEERQAFLLTLSDAVRPLDDPIAIRREACRRLGERLAAEHTYYVEYDVEHDRAVVAHDHVRGAGVPSLAAEYRLSAFGFVVPLYRRGAPVVVDDAWTSPLVPDADRATTAAAHPAWVAIPLVKGGTLVATLCVATATPRAWTPGEVALVGEVAERTWAAVERARAEAARRDSETRLRLALDAADMGAFVWYPADDRADADARTLAMFDLRPDETIDLATALAEHLHPDDRHRHAAAMARAVDPHGDGTLQSDFRVRRRDGSDRWLTVRGKTDFDGRRPVRLAGTLLDITERKRAEQATEQVQLAAARDELRRALGAAEEGERQRLARELHDQLGQELTAFRLGLDDAARLAAAHAPALAAPDAPLARRLAQLQALAARLTAGVRYLALELRPPELDDVGFESALETYVAEWSGRYGVAAEVAVAGLAPHGRTLPTEVASALYRIAQEALTNVAKHAAASQVSVIVEKPDGEVRLIVEDDGRGFDPDATARRVRRERRLGLAGMRERAALVGGTLQVESSPGAGTTVYVRLPVSHALD
jgi:PAS domain S-box-containing protein